MFYRAAMLTQSRRIEIQSVTLRRLRKHECLIRVAYAGVCGTDLAIYSGSYPVPLPLVLGHEFSGVVEQVGDAQLASLIGKPVTAEINNTCLAIGAEKPCAHCCAGRNHHCSRRTVLGIINCPGAFAEYVIVPSRNVHVLPASWPLRAGILIEPLAAALQTFEKTPLRKGDSVVVLGVGRLGALIALVAGKMGARVLAVCRSVRSRRQAASLGVKARAISSREGLIAAVRHFTRGLGADVVVEATGDSEMLSLALELVRPEGAVAVKSTPGAPARDLDLTRAVVDEITIQGSRCGPFGKAIAFARNHRIALDAFITEQFPLEKIETAFTRAERGGKIAIEMKAKRR